MRPPAKPPVIPILATILTKCFVIPEIVAGGSRECCGIVTGVLLPISKPNGRHGIVFRKVVEKGKKKEIREEKRAKKGCVYKDSELFLPTFPCLPRIQYMKGVTCL